MYTDILVSVLLCPHPRPEGCTWDMSIQAYVSVTLHICITCIPENPPCPCTLISMLDNRCCPVVSSSHHTRFTSHTLHITHASHHTRFTSHTHHITHDSHHTRFTSHTLHITHDSHHTRTHTRQPFLRRDTSRPSARISATIVCVASNNAAYTPGIWIHRIHTDLPSTHATKTETAA